MTHPSNTVPNEPIVSDAAIREVLRRQMHRAINMSPREFTRTTLAKESGVNVHTIDSILTRDEAKHRRVSLADAFSIVAVLGEGAVNALLAAIGFGGAKELDEADDAHPMHDMVKAMGALNVFAQAAVDDRIDHTEIESVRDASDTLIATFLPYSSHGGAA